MFINQISSAKALITGENPNIIPDGPHIAKTTELMISLDCLGLSEPIICSILSKTAGEAITQCLDSISKNNNGISRKFLIVTNKTPAPIGVNSPFST
jgi:hypothetical protein